MDTPKKPRSKLMSILATVVGVGVAAFYLISQFGPASLPECEESEVRSALRELLNKTGDGEGAGAADLDQIGQTAHDEEKEVRSCTATAKFADGAEEKLDYTVAWSNKDDREFEVFVATLPRCDRSEVQDTVRKIITDYETAGQPPRTLATVEQIADGGLDTTAALRSCTALARFEGGAEQKLSYTIKWNDAQKRQYYIELAYQQ
jgi:hypothetical protein